MDISFASKKHVNRSGKYQSELNLRDAKIYGRFSLLKRPKSMQKINTSHLEVNQLSRPKSTQVLNHNIGSKRSNLQRICSFYRSEVQLNRNSTLQKTTSIKRPKSLHCINTTNNEKLTSDIPTKRGVCRSKSFYEKFRSLRRKTNPTNENAQSKIELYKSQDFLSSTTIEPKDYKTTPFGLQLHAQTTPSIFPYEDTKPGVRYGYLFDCRRRRRN